MMQPGETDNSKNNMNKPLINVAIRLINFLIPVTFIRMQFVGI